jgi:hypothetical protein
MNAPQLIWLGWSGVCLGFALAKHGQPRDDRHSFWYSATATGIGIYVLWWGGFFAGPCAECGR